MNFARIIVLGIAILTAGGAAYLVRSMSTSQGPAVAALEEPVSVMATKDILVSTRSIAVGETLVAKDFRWQTWPEDVVHSSFIVRTASDEAVSKWDGAIVRSPVVEGEPLTRHKMVHIGKGGVMANILEPGMRGLGIKISAETGAGGFILPNDRVDVILTFKYRVEGERDDRYDSDTILRNVRVLAIDQTFREEDGQQVVVGRTATLELSSSEAEELALGVEVGEISLALRSLSNDALADDAAQGRKSQTRMVIVRNGRISGSQ
jgi:pilus assembly protein CpaB